MVYVTVTPKICVRGRLNKVQYQKVDDKKLAVNKGKWCRKICLWLGFPTTHTTYKYVRQQYFKFL